MIRYLLTIIPGFIFLTAVIQPCLAQTDLEGGKQLEGTVSSVSDSEVVINTTSEGSKTYRVDPEVLTALQLRSGNSVVLDSSRLETGVVKGLDAYTIKVELDNGDTRSFIFDREGRGTISVGDRIVITPKDFPSRCQKVYLLDNYELKAGDLRKIETYVAKAPAPVKVVQTPPPVVPPVVEVEPPPVPGLW